ncbi:RHS repeat-associated core domain-containing protein [Streptomyces sp. NPDC005381]|uniref:RHS repeat-associated core domain-containing protein n=1 Tax=Streptomyces sp. NPDC005381 TaxID=3364714 RepID=UPI00368CBA99
MAGNRPGDWHVLDLERDPTPGDPDRVRHLSKNLHDFADDVGDALRLIKGMAGEDAVLAWAGKSAKAFQDEFAGVPKQLKKLKKSYEMAGDALAAYWPKLERAQALADKALAKGRDAQSDLSSAKSRLSSADSWVTRANKEADKYKDDPTGSKDAEKPDEAKVRAATRDAQHAKSAHDSAQSDVTTASNALDAAKKMAADARTMREEAARDAKSKIDEASDAGIHNRKWWEEVGDWFSDNWDTIVAVCKVVVAVLGIIAMIIGGPILGAIVLIAALVVLADTLNKYAKGQASLWDVAFAALDCIPGMKGLTTLGGLAKGLKGGLAAMKGLKGGLKGMSLAARGLGKNARGMLADGAKGAFNRLKTKIFGCGDPVDVATGAMYLEQIDTELPGTLPLRFTRRVASNYSTGWWFGPSWSSTLDQRIEVDGDVVVFVTEDGMLLTYRRPEEPEIPSYPEQGPRWPLLLTADGGYRVDDPDAGHFRHFSSPVDGVAVLQRLTDRNGNSISFQYESDGTPTRIVHSGGYSLSVVTDEGRVTELGLSGAGGDGIVVKRFTYTDGNLTGVRGSHDVPLRFDYDERLRIASWTDTNGTAYHYTYDERNRCTVQGGESGHVAFTFCYDGSDAAWPDHRVTTVTSPSGSVSRYIVNAECQVVAEVDPLGALTLMTYDSDHRLLSRTDPLGHTTRVANDEWGRPTEIVRPDGARTTYTYNELGLPLTITLPDLATVRCSYDTRGNRTAITEADGAVTRYEYTDAGHMAALVDPLGNTTKVVTNSAGLPVEITDPLGAVIRHDRDVFGRTVRMTDQLGAVTHLAWTLEGRLACQTDADGSETWEYDGEGNCLRHQDAAGNITAYAYTYFDLLAERTEPDGARSTYTYDMDLRLTRVSAAAGKSWQFQYDAAGRLLAETDFGGVTTTYTYDPAGQLVSRTNALGQSVVSEYDALGRLVRKSAEGAVTDFRYDLCGRLLEAVGPDATVSMTRDPVGRLLTETVNGRTMTHGYDQLGRRLTRSTPSGVRSTWTYDIAGSAVELDTLGHSVRFARDLAGQEQARYFGRDTVLAHTYDQLGRVATQSLSTPGRARSGRRYSYRSDGVLSDIEGFDGTLSRYELNQAGRVTAAHGPQGVERYAYDEMGGQAQASWPRSLPGQEAIGDRSSQNLVCQRAGAVRYENDEQGRITLRQKSRLSRKPDTWRYEWDAEDRMRAVVTPDGTKWSYAYDPLGRRTAKMRHGENGNVVERVDFAWDGTSLCEQSANSVDLPNLVTLTWEHQGLHPVAQIERIMGGQAEDEEIDRRFFGIVTDLVGAPTEMVDEEGEIVWRTRSTVWGVTAWNRSATTYTPLRFPGQVFDPETGLNYSLFRHYDPETARYLSRDPMGLAAGLNPVAYVHNPLTWSDPLGLTPCEDAAKQAAARKETVLGPNLPSRAEASVGSTTSHSYKKTFFAAHPKLKGKVVVHHAIEQQVLKRYPGLFSADELHSLENLRGIPKGDINSRIHLSQIRVEWNRFYDSNPNPTRQEVLNHVTRVDDMLGNWFSPRIR